MGDFKQLSVWQLAHRLALEIYGATSVFPSSERFGLAAQLRKTALSITSNIAEGCGRGGHGDLIRFCTIARGSVHELEAQLLLARDLGFLPGERWQALAPHTDHLSRMLKSLIRAIRQSKAPV